MEGSPKIEICCHRPEQRKNYLPSGSHLFVETKSKPYLPNPNKQPSEEKMQKASEHLQLLITPEDPGFSESRMRLIQLAKYLLGTHSLILVSADFVQGPTAAYVLSVITANLGERTLIAAIEDDHTLLSFFDETAEMSRGQLLQIKSLSHE